MALLKIAVALLVMATLFAVPVSYAAVYKVGDSAGWTTIGNIDYKQWAATKTFQVGDIIHFEYNPQFHNVMRVTHAMYRACNTSAPLATFTTGNDSITITAKGHHFFFCGVPGHCQSGQKVDINVLRTPTTTDETAPTPSATVLAPPPSVPATKAAGPSSSEAGSLRPFECLLGKVVLGMLAVAFFVSNAA
ncbi:Phytocyanin domain-containing protein [Citrus sinensis]|uniref:Phytocyanin domain-containing protein n=3 Tax=Citrus TaxID=2706 RepID=A0A067G7U8_CITSI|nr:mavicyanin [Citrus x clementina]XP_015389120.1 mavicyanin [Citrus sinensis]GAY42553.1 hypothetical protein CUMW_067800 [Citrus unshiu]ESR33131.1 hypothetical protein CICLE_v10005979mg [Citrus x clementina]KAH9682749.1 Phytocyanin domain-containing protein [Citrus sinensis]KAH9765101.1 Phytocyanin domain-containing protein [Citrus sinensis]KDO74665.1 hypothetical protein CISIN_1g029659mg [Citrus sinensis]